MTNRDRRRGALRRRIDELRRRTTAAVEALRALEDQPGDGPLLFLLDSTRPDDASLRRALAAAFRSPADAAEIPRIAARLLGAYLRASRVRFAEHDGQAWLVRAEYPPSQGSPSPIHGASVSALHAGQTVVSRGTGGASVAVPREFVDTDLLAGVHITVPLLHEGRLVALFSVGQDRDRYWTDREVMLVQEVADRTFEAVERARAEQALRDRVMQTRLFADHQRARLASVLRLLPEGVIIAEAPFGRFVLSNERASQIWGHPPIAAANIGDYTAYKGFHPDGRAYEPKEWPLARAILHGEVVDQEEIRFERGDGAAGWMTVSAAPVRDDGENIIAGITTFLDVTERRQTVDAKDEFIAVLAHELRNPLAPIRTAAGILRGHDLQDPIVDRCSQVIDRQVRHMARLLDDLLDVTRLSRGTLSLQRAPVDLHACLEGAIEMARPLVEAADHTLSLSGTHDRIALEADEARITQIFANLLTNAAKYTPPRGHIRVHVRRDDSHVSVHVQDTGVGIPASLLASVFDMFHPMTPAMDRAASGLGVGLALTRQLVEMHGGTIQARSEGTGRGSEFIVRLPTMAGAARVPLQRVGEADAERPPTAHRVLVIDDNRDAADTSAELLAALGCLVDTAYDGPSALEAAGRVVPDIVLLDLGMPGMNGLEVCRRMRQEPWGPGVFIIALTGWGDARDRHATTEACFDDHLVKPVDPEQLAHVIRTHERS